MPPCSKYSEKIRDREAFSRLHDKRQWVFAKYHGFFVLSKPPALAHLHQVIGSPPAMRRDFSKTAGTFFLTKHHKRIVLY
jgi:hypothetical protein